MLCDRQYSIDRTIIIILLLLMYVRTGVVQYEPVRASGHHGGKSNNAAHSCRQNPPPVALFSVVIVVIGFLAGGRGFHFDCPALRCNLGVHKHLLGKQVNTPTQPHTHIHTHPNKESVEAK